MRYSYDMVRRWTKSIDIFSLSTVFIPVIRAAHWVLVVVSISVERGTISLFDSLDLPDASTGRGIRRWLVDEATDKGKPQRAWKIDNAACRHQENTDDCDVFTLKNMDYIARGLDVLDMKRSTAY